MPQNERQFPERGERDLRLSNQGPERVLRGLRDCRGRFSGGWQRFSDLRVPEGTQTEKENELLHCFPGNCRFFGRPAWHSLRHYVVNRTTKQFARVFVYRVFVGGFVHDLNFLFGRRVSGSILGHIASDGVFQKRTHQDCFR